MANVTGVMDTVMEKIRTMIPHDIWKRMAKVFEHLEHKFEHLTSDEYSDKIMKQLQNACRRSSSSSCSEGDIMVV